MANKIFEEMNVNNRQFMKQLNDLKSKGGDPNAMIQNLLNTGRVSQAQVNRAAQMAQSLMQILPLGGRR